MSRDNELAWPVPGDGGRCTLLLLRTPLHLLVGLDMAQWRVGKKFQGIRSIEPGCHFLHWTENGGSQIPSDAPQEAECTYTRMRVDEAIGSTGQRGEFLFFKEGQIIIREWSASLGRFLPLSEDETLRYAAGVERQDFVHGLGLYPKHMVCQWNALTGNISDACVSRVEPIGHCLEAQGMPLTEQEQGYIDKHTPEKTKQDRHIKKRISFKRADTGTDEEAEGETPTQTAEDENEVEREIRDSAEAAACKMFYMDVPAARSSAVRAAREAAAAARRRGSDAAAAASAAAAAVTMQCTDRTDTLIQLIQENEEGWRGILGELQMTFIALVLGHHYPSLVHWRELVELLTSSERAVYLYPEFYVKFIASFHAQLEQAPDEMTEGALQEGSFLSSSCAALLETCYIVDRTAAFRALENAASGNSFVEKPKAGRKAISGEETNAATGTPAVNEKEATAERFKAMEPHYKEVEKAASKLCDLVRLLFKVSRGGGELGEISQLDEILLALQGPDAPVVVETADTELGLSSDPNEREEPMQAD